MEWVEVDRSSPTEMRPLEQWACLCGHRVSVWTKPEEGKL